MNIKAFLTLSLTFIQTSLVFSQYKYAFQNPDLPVEERIDSLVALMTLDEKIYCLSTDPSVPRLGVKGTYHVEGLHGLAMGGPSNWGQKHPAPTTIFPQAIGLAETWDTALIRKVAEVEGYEVRYMFQNKKYSRGGLVVRAPNADIGRDPRWGRTEECFGEDAWFNAQLIVSFIKGLQGNHPKYWLTASLMKHFLANSNENGRDTTSSDFDERLFREYYSYPFYKGITEGGSRAFMAAYNAYNSIPMAVHPVLKDVTVNEWGNDGIICTDGGAFRLLVDAHKYYDKQSRAAVGCLRAGITQFLDYFHAGTYAALANGYITEALMDSAIRGNFRVMIKLGQFDPPELVPYKTIGVSDTLEPWLSEKNKQIALEATRKSIVLLKNTSNTLPLNKEKLKSVAVIGPYADSVLLDWYSGTPPYRISILEGIKNKLSRETKVSFVRDNKYNKAVEAAKMADLAIMVVGNHPTGNDSWAKCPVPSDGKEAVDRKAIHLEQEQLIKLIYDANPNTIVILVSSFPYTINWTQKNIPAIVHVTHCSQEQGTAIADVLFGDYNPAGRLVQTWPASIKHLPDMMDYNIRNGRTYMYAKEKPLYPFGYGLSYSSFEYKNLELSDKQLSSEGSITISFDIKNTSKVNGDEVAQLYVRFPDSKIERPVKQLRGFQRVNIQAGETCKVKILLEAEDLAYWNVKNHRWEIEEGEVELMVGSSSEDIRLTKKFNVVK